MKSTLCVIVGICSYRRTSGRTEPECSARYEVVGPGGFHLSADPTTVGDKVAVPAPPASATWVARSGDGAPPSTRSRRPPRTRPPVGRPTRSPRSRSWRPPRPPRAPGRRTRPGSAGTRARSPAGRGFRAHPSTCPVWHVSRPHPSLHHRPTVPAMRKPYPGTQPDTREARGNHGQPPQTLDGTTRGQMDKYSPPGPPGSRRKYAPGEIVHGAGVLRGHPDRRPHHSFETYTSPIKAGRVSS